MKTNNLLKNESPHPPLLVREISPVCVDAAYAVFRVITGFIYSSVWFVSLAVYRFFLGFVRLYLLMCKRKAGSKNVYYEYKRYALTACFLLVLSIPAAGIISLTVLQNAAITYHGYMIYACAAYTFYAVTISIVKLVKYKKSGSPILVAAKIVCLIAALVALLELQSSMIAAFSDGDIAFMKTMNALTGAAVFLAIIVTAVLMLIRAYKNLKGETRE